MIDPRYIKVIDDYVNEAKKRKWGKIEFAWSYEEEINKSLQDKTCRYVMGKYFGCRVKNIGWGFSVEFKHE